MSHIVGIVGPSGNGKSHGIQFLNPKETLLINADRKPLPFKGWMNIYNRENKNYIENSSPSQIKRIIKDVEQAESLKHIKELVIDTAAAVMIDDEMRRMGEQNYDKWTDLAVAVYDILNTLQGCRKDLVAYIMFHEESFLDDDGIRTTRICTNGKKLNKINLASRMTTVLWSKVESTDPGKNRFYFETLKNHNEAKSPEGMFSSFEIENNLALVSKAVREYDGIK